MSEPGFKCHMCQRQIAVGVLCNDCYVARKQLLISELEGEGPIGPLDSHGAMIDPEAAKGQTVAEMDTSEEFSGLIIKRKVDFGATARPEKVATLFQLKQYTEPIKNHLRESFANWLLIGYPLAKEDPLLLEVRVENWQGETVHSAAKTFSMSGQVLPQSMAFKLEEELFSLPELFNQCGPHLKPYRKVFIRLAWWATMTQQKHEDFLAEIEQRKKAGKPMATGAEFLRGIHDVKGPTDEAKS